MISRVVYTLVFAKSSQVQSWLMVIRLFVASNPKRG